MPPAGWAGHRQPVRRCRHRAAGPAPASSGSACTPSSRWATRPTCPATTCWPPGTTTPRSPPPRSTSSRSATPAKFARFARRFAERKPLLAVVGGRSTGGQRAGASHTAAAASPAVGVEALFAQSGVIGCADAEDLADTALLLTEQPLPAGRRLARAQQRRRHGRAGRRRAPRTWVSRCPSSHRGLRAGWPSSSTAPPAPANPVDAGAGCRRPSSWPTSSTPCSARARSTRSSRCWSPPGSPTARRSCAAWSEVRSRTRRSPSSSCRSVASGRRAHASPHHDVPLDLVGAAGPGPGRPVRRVAGGAERAPAPRPIRDAGADPGRRRGAEWCCATPGAEGRWLGRARRGRCSTPTGSAVLGDVATRSRTTRHRGGRGSGFPVAVKLADAGVVHKTEREAGADGASDPRAGAARRARLRAVELAMASPRCWSSRWLTGIEIALGVVRDPAHGAAGHGGGRWRGDRRVGRPGLPAAAGLAGRRAASHPARCGSGPCSRASGAPAADVAGLERLVVDLGRLAVDVPEVAELDLNPVMVAPDGCVVVDAKVRLATPVGPDSSAPRQLRPVH